MLVTIVGCGALGCVLAARLIQGGIKVQALQRPGPQLNALRKNGVVISADRHGGDTRLSLEGAASDPAELAPPDLSIVLVKSYATKDVAPACAFLAQSGPVLTLQNGLGNAETLAESVPPDRLAAGVATYGAHRPEPGVAVWGGDGTIVLGQWASGPDAARDETQDMEWIAGALADAGLDAKYVPDPRPAIWRKLCINAMVNPVAALSGQGNAFILADPGTRNLMRDLGREAVTAASRAGADLDFDEMWQTLKAILQRTAANRPSMLQDVEASRRTEIDAISGGVLALARDEDEFPHTRTVYRLVRAVDRSNGF